MAPANPEPQGSDTTYNNAETLPTAGEVEESLNLKCQASSNFQDTWFLVDHESWKKRIEAWTDNDTAAANLMWQKCTSHLQAQIKDEEDSKVLLTDVLQMKKAIKKHCTAAKPESHALIPIINALRTLDNI